LSNLLQPIDLNVSKDKEWEEEKLKAEETKLKVVGCDRDSIDFRLAVTRGLRRWIQDKSLGNPDDLEVQFALARVAAGVKKFCSPSVKSYQQKMSMLFYTALCMKNLFALTNKQYNWWSGKDIKKTSFKDSDD